MQREFKINTTKIMKTTEKSNNSGENRKKIPPEGYRGKAESHVKHDKRVNL